MNLNVLAIVLTSLMISPVFAAPIAGRVVQDAALQSEILNRLTIGVGHETIDRQINMGGDPDAHLRANALFGSLSLDVTPNASIYVGLNHTTVDRIGALTKLDDRDDIDWFAGIHLNIWEHMMQPARLVDARLSIGLTADLANYSSVNSGTEAKWDSTVIALPVAYQLFTAKDVRTTVHSAKFFLGPLLSMIDGDVTSAGSNTSFDESENNGVLFGVDVFATEQFVIGGQAQFLNDYSYSFNARYHF